MCIASCIFYMWKHLIKVIQYSFLVLICKCFFVLESFYNSTGKHKRVPGYKSMGRGLSLTGYVMLSSWWPKLNTVLRGFFMSPDKLWLDVMTQKVLKTFVTQTLIIRKAYARVMLNICYSYVADADVIHVCKGLWKLGFKHLKVMCRSAFSLIFTINTRYILSLVWLDLEEIDRFPCQAIMKDLLKHWHF